MSSSSSFTDDDDDVQRVLMDGKACFDQDSAGKCSRFSWKMSRLLIKRKKIRPPTTNKNRSGFQVHLIIIKVTLGRWFIQDNIGKSRS